MVLVRIYRGMHVVPVQLVPYLDAMVVQQEGPPPGGRAVQTSGTADAQLIPKQSMVLALELG